MIWRSASTIAFIPTRLQSNASRIVIFDFQTIQHISTCTVGVDIDVIINGIKIHIRIACSTFVHCKIHSHPVLRRFSQTYTLNSHYKLGSMFNKNDHGYIKTKDNVYCLKINVFLTAPSGGGITSNFGDDSLESLSFCRRNVPWLGEDRTVLYPDLSVLCYPLPNGTLPVLV